MTYPPTEYRVVTDPGAALALMREHPFAHVITAHRKLCVTRLAVLANVDDWRADNLCGKTGESHSRRITIGKRVRMLALLGTIGFAAGCNSDGATGTDDSGGTGGTTCVAPTGLICEPSGLPFVMLTGATSDACAGSRLGECADPPLSTTTARLMQPEAGELCLSGSVVADGMAKIVLIFSTFNAERTKILRVFDPHSLAITQVGFTLVSPPSGGVTVTAAVVTATDCPESPRDCFTPGFDLMTASSNGTPAVFRSAGSQVAHFANFQQTQVGVGQHFDKRALHHLEFYVGPGDYDFCVRDLKFLDSTGAEINP